MFDLPEYKKFQEENELDKKEKPKVIKKNEAFDLSKYIDDEENLVQKFRRSQLRRQRNLFINNIMSAVGPGLKMAAKVGKKIGKMAAKTLPGAGGLLNAVKKLFGFGGDITK